jgi:hypothetical protein
MKSTISASRATSRSSSASNRPRTWSTIASIRSGAGARATAAATRWPEAR